MVQQVPIDPAARADDNPIEGVYQITPDLAYQRLAIVNIQLYGAPGAGDRQWALIDAGVSGTAFMIREAAKRRFGPDSRPAAIILTHGHFDHVGALADLAEEWDAPIYAHELERPYLDGRSAYPPPDPTVGGGFMAGLAGFYPRGPIDVGKRLHALPADGSVPAMPGWRWIATPGHTPGHVALWRESDRTLIAGDAFITTRQESAFAVALQFAELHGPPMYYTPDWIAARRSVEKLAALEPDLAVTGHGPAMRGPAFSKALHKLADNFDQLAVPPQGRYVGQPAQADATGVTFVPPKKPLLDRSITANHSTRRSRADRYRPVQQAFLQA
jgi:glyoxylase-like metal-dependent hydrolase (beta-lactamase superfamily II)